ncbi:MAG TPA: biotin--[acetyl-CoA-carboxylase] ligase [Pseudonocardiaceae bacterium]|jgi:BirA family biotin operon repressor/biotin-[acetyl-CoA-carboxylase] ligase|nr:biotin--[acetyl-CoA-carboxylase] ligase [Pseudonocardiaceae bacterium]
MDVERLRSLADRYPAIDVVPSVESTNARLVADAAGLADRTVLIAEEQTAGQGRRSRTWVSPAGTGLYLSVLLRPPLPAGRLSWLTLLAGVALVRTARAAGAQAVLKWPNDLLLGPDQRKGAGVLAEATQGAVVLGIGLNLRPLPADVPLGPGGLAPTSLAEAVGGDVDPTEIAVRLLTELADLEDAWRAAAGDPAAGGTHDEYTGYCVTIGQQVRVELQRGTVTGTALGIDPSGGLSLRADDGSDQVISAGDVVHLRPAH